MYNKKLFLVILVLSLFSLMGGSIYYHKMQLIEDVFIKHYYEYEYHDFPWTQLYYLTNKTDDRRIYSVDLIAEDGSVLSCTADHASSYTVSPFHELREIRLQYYFGSEINVETTKEHIFTTAQITYSNSDTLEVPIGDIILYPTIEEQERLQRNNGSSSASSTGKAEHRGVLTQSVQLIDSGSKLYPQIRHYFDITLNDMPLEDQRIEQGQWYKVSTQFSIPVEDPRSLEAYNICYRLYFEDDDGNQLIDPVYNISSKPYFPKPQTVYRYLKDRGAL